jgi:DNA-binding transcriptional MerR regulator
VRISESALRYYHKKDIFIPVKQGKEHDNNYRYYSPLQITIVKLIRVLVEIGVPLNTIKEVSKSRSPEKMLKLLSKNKDTVADELRFLHEVYSVICMYIELLKDGISVTESEISVSILPERRIILGEPTDYAGESGFVREFARFCVVPHNPKLNMSYPIGGYWDSMAAFVDEPSRPMRFFSLDPQGNEKRAEGLYLTGYTRGYYGQTNDLPGRMVAFARKNGLVFSGPIYNVYLFDEISIADPEQYLLQASASVMETRHITSRHPNRR